MAKELKSLIEVDAAYLNTANPVEARKVRHLTFSSNTGDIISIPLCGIFSGSDIVTQKLRNVTCINCLNRLQSLAPLDTYAQALAYITTYAPDVPAEDLKYKLLALAADAPLNMIGTTPATYFFNMTKLLIIDSDGEPIQDTLDEIALQIDDL